MGDVMSTTRKSFCLLISYVQVISHPKFELSDKGLSRLSDIFNNNFPGWLVY